MSEITHLSLFSGIGGCNAVVPQQFYPVFRAIAEIERSLYGNE